MTANHLLRNRNFLYLWLGQFVSLFGDNIHNVAVAWWIYQKTGSVRYSSLVLICVSLPFVLFGPFAGVLVDRLDRKTILVGADIIRGLLLLFFAFLAANDLLSPNVVLGLTFLLSTISTIFNPAVFAVVPDIVAREDLVQANSTHEFTMELTKVLGPAIGGVLLSVYDIWLLFLANGISFCLSGLSETLIRIETKPRTSGSIGNDLKAGLDLFATRPILLAMVLFFSGLNFFFVPLLAFIPYFAKDVFNKGPLGLGMMESAISLGLIATALYLFLTKRKVRLYRVIVLAPLVIATSYILIGASPNFFPSLLLLGCVGAAIGMININVISFFQTQIPGEMLGRFMGLINVLIFALQPISFLVAGFIAETVKPENILVGCGVAIILLCAVATRLPALRKTEQLAL